MRPSRPNRNSQRAGAVSPRAGAGGYTLLELMIVIVIIAVVSALAVPGIVNSMRENKAYQGASDITRLFRQARLDAVSRGAAVAVRFNQTTQGDFRMYRSPVSSCRLSNWTAAGGAGPLDGTLFTALDFSLSPYQVTGGADIRARYCRNLSANKQICQAPPNPIMWICYSPAGRIYWRSSDAGAFNDGAVGATMNIDGGWPFRVERWEAGAPVGVFRVAFVPYGSSGARVQQ